MHFPASGHRALPAVPALSTDVEERQKRKREQASNIRCNGTVHGKNSFSLTNTPKSLTNPPAARRGEVRPSLQSMACLLLTQRGLGFILQFQASLLLAGLLPQAPRRTWQRANAADPRFRGSHVRTNNPFDKTSRGKVSGGQHKAKNGTQGCNTADPNHS